MHELSICRGIIDVARTALAEQAVPGARPSTVTVRIGRLTGIVADSVRYYFDLLTLDTPLAGATLLIDEVPIRGRCADCEARFEIDTLAFTCPACESGFVELLSGHELQVVALETTDEVLHGS